MADNDNRTVSMVDGANVLREVPATEVDGARQNGLRVATQGEVERWNSSPTINMWDGAGILRSVPKEKVDDALGKNMWVASDDEANDWHSQDTVTLFDRKKADFADVPKDQIDEAVRGGAFRPSREFLQQYFGGEGDPGVTLAEGLAQGGTAGLYGAGAKMLGLDSYVRNMRMRAQARPGTAATGEVAGGLGLGLATGGAGIVGELGSGGATAARAYGTAEAVTAGAARNVGREVLSSAGQATLGQVNDDYVNDRPTQVDDILVAGGLGASLGWVGGKASNMLERRAAGEFLDSAARTAPDNLNDIAPGLRGQLNKATDGVSFAGPPMVDGRPLVGWSVDPLSAASVGSRAARGVSAAARGAEVSERSIDDAYQALRVAREATPSQGMLAPIARATADDALPAVERGASEVISREMPVIEREYRQVVESARKSLDEELRARLPEAESSRVADTLTDIRRTVASRIDDVLETAPKGFEGIASTLKGITSDNVVSKLQAGLKAAASVPSPEVAAIREQLRQLAAGLPNGRAILLDDAINGVKRAGSLEKPELAIDVIRQLGGGQPETVASAQRIAIALHDLALVKADVGAPKGVSDKLLGLAVGKAGAAAGGLVGGGIGGALLGHILQGETKALTRRAGAFINSAVRGRALKSEAIASLVESARRGTAKGIKAGRGAAASRPSIESLQEVLSLRDPQSKASVALRAASQTLRSHGQAELADAYDAKVASIANAVASKRDALSPSGVVNPNDPLSHLRKNRIDPVSEGRLARYAHGAANPGGVLENLAKGTATKDEVDALRDVHPAVFDTVVRGVMRGLGQLDDLPDYERLNSLSNLLGVPLDRSENPEYVGFLQSTMQASEQQPEPSDLAPAAPRGSAPQIDDLYASRTDQIMNPNGR
jgi:hypothetical protein